MQNTILIMLKKNFVSIKDEVAALKIMKTIIMYLSQVIQSTLLPDDNNVLFGTKFSAGFLIN